VASGLKFFKTKGNGEIQILLRFWTVDLCEKLKRDGYVVGVFIGTIGKESYIEDLMQFIRTSEMKIALVIAGIVREKSIENLLKDADFENIVRDANSRGLGVIKWDVPLLGVAQDQRQPVRQGLFGVLSVGFLAAIFLTVLGFFLYSFFSFRRRFVELGVLRAIGLSSAQMTRFLAWELIFLIFTGITIGTGLGVAVSNLFIPYLQIGEGLRAQYPPFIVEISWEPILPIYLLYGLLFLLALAVLVFLLMRMRIFEAVKLGETT